MSKSDAMQLILCVVVVSRSWITKSQEEPSMDSLSNFIQSKRKKKEAIIYNMKLFEMDCVVIK